MNYGVFRWDLVYFGVYTDRVRGAPGSYEEGKLLFKLIIKANLTEKTDQS